MFRKKKNVFTDPKDRFCLKRISEGSKKSAVGFLSSTCNLYLREIIFITDDGVLTIETFLIERKARV